MPQGAKNATANVREVENSQKPFQAGPEAEYRRRLIALGREEDALAKADRRWVAAKISIFVIGALIGAWLVKYAPGRLSLLAIVLAIFIGAFVLHERVLRRMRVARQRTQFYERGLARLEGRWVGTGRQGEQFLEASHPYARDLDLFGKGGLFELMCTARTSAGEQRLASWLLAAAPLSEIAQRQTAVAELAPRTDFQERMALAAEDVQAEGAQTPEALAAWAESGEGVNRTPVQLAVLALAFGWVASILLWFLSRLDAIPLWHWGVIALAFSVVNASLSSVWKKRRVAAAEAVEAAGNELPLIAAVFSAIEQEKFSSAKLAALQQRLLSAGMLPSRAISKLSDYREWIVGANDHEGPL